MRMSYANIMLMGLLCAHLFIIQAEAQDEEQLKVPKIYIPETTFDFGAQLYDKPISHFFQARNDGTVPLTLQLGKASCGCTVHSVEDFSVLPGESTQIQIGYNPKVKEKHPGLHNFTTELTTNDPNNPKMAISIKGRLVDQVDTRTQRINFGTITKAPLPSQPLRIDCYGDTFTPKVISIKAESPKIKISTLKLEETSNRRSYIYEIELDTKGLATDFKSFITVKTDSIRVPSLEIPVQVQHISPIVISPSRALFSICYPGSDKTIKISLRSTEKDTQVSGAKSTHEFIKVSLAKDKNPNNWVLNATLHPSGTVEKPTPLKTSILLLDKNGKTLSEIPVHAIIMPSKK